MTQSKVRCQKCAAVVWKKKKHKAVFLEVFWGRNAQPAATRQRTRSICHLSQMWQDVIYVRAPTHDYAGLAHSSINIAPVSFVMSTVCCFLSILKNKKVSLQCSLRIWNEHLAPAHEFWSDILCSSWRPCAPTVPLLCFGWEMDEKIDTVAATPTDQTVPFH